MKLSVMMIATVGAALQLSAATAVYKVDLLHDSVIEGQQLKAGSYKLEIKDSSDVVLMRGKQVVNLVVRQETASEKFVANELEYKNDDTLESIHLAGTNLKLDFDAVASAPNAGGQ